MNANEQKIRERAHELWDDAGRPDGRSDEFWFAAGAELEREEATGEESPEAVTTAQPIGLRPPG
jgi:hypothetical protein